MAYANIQSRVVPFVARYIMDLMMFRHLCWNLVGSDLRARFRRSRVGILWAVIQPLAFAMMIAGVWGTLMNMENYWVYALYVFSGLILWEYFGTVVNVSQDALITAEGYLKQTRIPFIAFQVRTPLTAMVIFFFGLIGLLIMQGALGMFPSPAWTFLLIPPFMVLLLLFGIPVSILMSVIGILFRDTKYISQIVVQGLFFVSPVMLDRVVLDRPEIQFLKYLNPVVPLLDLLRDPLLHGRLWSASALLIMLTWIAILWVLAIAVSAKVGRRLVFAL